MENIDLIIRKISKYCRVQFRKKMEIFNRKEHFVILICIVSTIQCFDWCLNSRNDVCDNNSTPKNILSLDDDKHNQFQGTCLESYYVKNKNRLRKINVIVTFTNAGHELGKKLRVMLRSLFHHASIPIVIHFIGEKKSQQIAEDIIMAEVDNSNYKIVQLDFDHLVQQMGTMMQEMRHYFGGNPGSYYNHMLFFLSITMHRVLPKSLHRVIMLDVDLKFTDDIKKLYRYFQLFNEENVMGIAREMQPVYRDFLSEYRSENSETRVGEPGPDGLTGFNSGVMLLDLDAMRKSHLYNKLLNIKVIEQMIGEFHFRGHLGDQDLFTLMSFKYEQLFYILPCNWNRQLCTWFRDHGYADVFHQYHTCDGDIKIWHGNCNTTIPNDR